MVGGYDFSEMSEDELPKRFFLISLLLPPLLVSDSSTSSETEDHENVQDLLSPPPPPPPPPLPGHVTPQGIPPPPPPPPPFGQLPPPLLPGAELRKAPADTKKYLPVRWQAHRVTCADPGSFWAVCEAPSANISELLQSFLKLETSVTKKAAVEKVSFQKSILFPPFLFLTDA
jgi:hypothetical protein